MILISHRGNIYGKQSELENTPQYITNALELGYDVEIDIWFLENKFKLGHDEPTYDLPSRFLEKYSDRLWIHCKDRQSLSKLNKMDKRGLKFNYFSHVNDEGVLTSKGYIWSTNLYDGGILVMPELFNKKPFEGTVGICSDVVSNYKTNKAYTNE